MLVLNNIEHFWAEFCDVASSSGWKPWRRDWNLNHAHTVSIAPIIWISCHVGGVLSGSVVYLAWDSLLNGLHSSLLAGIRLAWLLWMVSRSVLAEQLGHLDEGSCMVVCGMCDIVISP